MELDKRSNGDDASEPQNPTSREVSADLEVQNNLSPNRSSDEIYSTCSTPYESAPSSPGHDQPTGGYFFSAPASPMHYILSSSPYSASPSTIAGRGCTDSSFSTSFEFEFSARYACSAGTSPSGLMTSADELFLNGQIRPMKLSSHLQWPQVLAPLLDLDEDEEIEKENGELVKRGRDLSFRSRSLHRRAGSMPPLRNARFQCQEDDAEEQIRDPKDEEMDEEENKTAEMLTPSVSASSSRSSSSGRNPKRWIFLKDLLYRSKSEGRVNAKEFWQTISFSSSKEKSKHPSFSPLQQIPISDTSEKQSRKNGSTSSKKHVTSSTASASTPSKTPSSVGKRRLRAPSLHERHYAAKRAQAEEMRKRTFLPYRQGLLGCLGFSSRGYSAVSGIAKTLNPVSSR